MLAAPAMESDGKKNDIKVLKMASSSEASCISDPNFAVICAFLERFAKLCGITYPTFVDLQEMLENVEQVSQELIDLHIKLLRKARKTVFLEKWEKALIKFCHTYSSQDGWEIERFGYKKSRLEVKLRVLKMLLEGQFDLNSKFKASINTLESEELRSKPLGKDNLGRSYWLQFDPSSNIRVYREDLDEESWTLIAQDRDSLLQLLKDLSGDDVPLDLNFLNEENPSLDVNKPIVDTGQDGELVENDNHLKENDELSVNANFKEDGQTDNIDNDSKPNDSSPLEEKITNGINHEINDENDHITKKVKLDKVPEKKEELKDDMIVGEAIEEPVMYITGEGKGEDCQTGNPEKDEKSQDETENLSAENTASEEVEISTQNPSDIDRVNAEKFKPTPKLWSIDTICGVNSCKDTNADTVGQENVDLKVKCKNFSSFSIDSVLEKKDLSSPESSFSKFSVKSLSSSSHNVVTDNSYREHSLFLNTVRNDQDDKIGSIDSSKVLLYPVNAKTEVVGKHENINQGPGFVGSPTKEDDQNLSISVESVVINSDNCVTNTEQFVHVIEKGDFVKNREDEVRKTDTNFENTVSQIMEDKSEMGVVNEGKEVVVVVKSDKSPITTSVVDKEGQTHKILFEKGSSSVSDEKETSTCKTENSEKSKIATECKKVALNESVVMGVCAATKPGEEKPIAMGSNSGIEQNNQSYKLLLHETKPKFTERLGSESQIIEKIGGTGFDDAFKGKKNDHKGNFSKNTSTNVELIPTKFLPAEHNKEIIPDFIKVGEKETNININEDWNSKERPREGKLQKLQESLKESGSSQKSLLKIEGTKKINPEEVVTGTRTSSIEVPHEEKQETSKEIELSKEGKSQSQSMDVSEKVNVGDLTKTDKEVEKGEKICFKPTEEQKEKIQFGKTRILLEKHEKSKKIDEVVVKLQATQPNKGNLIIEEKPEDLRIIGRECIKETKVIEQTEAQNVKTMSEPEIEDHGKKEEFLKPNVQGHEQNFLSKPEGVPKVGKLKEQHYPEVLIKEKQNDKTEKELGLQIEVKRSVPEEMNNPESELEKTGNLTEWTNQSGKESRNEIPESTENIEISLFKQKSSKEFEAQREKPESVEEANEKNQKKMDGCSEKVEEEPKINVKEKEGRVLLEKKLEIKSNSELEDKRHLGETQEIFSKSKKTSRLDKNDEKIEKVQVANPEEEKILEVGRKDDKKAQTIAEVLVKKTPTETTQTVREDKEKLENALTREKVEVQVRRITEQTIYFGLGSKKSKEDHGKLEVLVEKTEEKKIVSLPKNENSEILFGKATKSTSHFDGNSGKEKEKERKLEQMPTEKTREEQSKVFEKKKEKKTLEDLFGKIAGQTAQLQKSGKEDKGKSERVLTDNKLEDKSNELEKKEKTEIFQKEVRQSTDFDIKKPEEDAIEEKEENVFEKREQTAEKIEVSEKEVMRTIRFDMKSEKADESKQKPQQTAETTKANTYKIFEKKQEYAVGTINTVLTYKNNDQEIKEKLDATKFEEKIKGLQKKEEVKNQNEQPKSLAEAKLITSGVHERVKKEKEEFAKVQMKEKMEKKETIKPQNEKPVIIVQETSLLDKKPEKDKEKPGKSLERKADELIQKLEKSQIEKSKLLGSEDDEKTKILIEKKVKETDKKKEELKTQSKIVDVSAKPTTAENIQFIKRDKKDDEKSQVFMEKKPEEKNKEFEKVEKAQSEVADQNLGGKNQKGLEDMKLNEKELQKEKIRSENKISETNETNEKSQGGQRSEKDTDQKENTTVEEKIVEKVKGNENINEKFLAAGEKLSVETIPSLQKDEKNKDPSVNFEIEKKNEEEIKESQKEKENVEVLTEHEKEPAGTIQLERKEGKVREKSIKVQIEKKLEEKVRELEKKVEEKMKEFEKEEQKAKNDKPATKVEKMLTETSQLERKNEKGKELLEKVQVGRKSEETVEMLKKKEEKNAQNEKFKILVNKMAEKTVQLDGVEKSEVKEVEIEKKIQKKEKDEKEDKREIRGESQDRKFYETDKRVEKTEAETSPTIDREGEKKDQTIFEKNNEKYNEGKFDKEKFEAIKKAEEGLVSKEKAKMPNEKPDKSDKNSETDKLEAVLMEKKPEKEEKTTQNEKLLSETKEEKTEEVGKKAEEVRPDKEEKQEEEKNYLKKDMREVEKEKTLEKAEKGEIDENDGKQTERIVPETEEEKEDKDQVTRKIKISEKEEEIQEHKDVAAEEKRKSEMCAEDEKAGKGKPVRSKKTEETNEEEPESLDEEMETTKEDGEDSIKQEETVEEVSYSVVMGKPGRKQKKVPPLRILSRNRKTMEEEAKAEAAAEVVEKPRGRKGRKPKAMVKADEESNEGNIDQGKRTTRRGAKEPPKEDSKELESDNKNEPDEEEIKPEVKKPQKGRPPSKKTLKRLNQSAAEEGKNEGEEKTKKPKTKEGEEDGKEEDEEKEDGSAKKKEKSGRRQIAAREIKLLGISEIDTNLPSIRQSRRIAQIKMKEEAERRRAEAIQLESFKNKRKKLGPGKKKSKKIVDSYSEEEGSGDDSDAAVKGKPGKEEKKRRRRRKKKDKLVFNELNPWLSSSGSTTVDEEEEEIEDEIHEDEEFVLKSDHEFSPESDVEDPDYKPVKRARTARVEESKDVVGPGKYDDTSCEKCRKNDHPEWILLCDKCDKGWHGSCLRPALMIIPEGDWFCPPCEHLALISKLKESLIKYDRLQKQRENEELRRKRLAFVGISLDNVLSVAKKKSSKHEDEDKEERSTEGESESESESSESGSSSGGSSEPVYQLRERRSNVTSYRYNEYDELIKSALQDEIEAVKGAGNAGRGKDINNIVNAEREGKKEGEEDKNAIGEGEDATEEKKEKPATVKTKTKKDDDYEVDTEGDEEDDEDAVDELPPVVPKYSTKKKKSKSSKITSLDFTSEEEDHNSDSDFKGSGSDEESDGSSASGSDSSDGIGRRRRGFDGPLRRSTRARVSRYDKDFINDDSEDESPKRKKNRSQWASSESSDSDEAWGKRKRKKYPSSRARSSSSRRKSRNKGKSRKRIKKAPDSDNEDNLTPKKPRSRKIKYGGLDSLDEEQVLNRRTRGKKINYQEMNGSDSEDEIRSRKTRPARVIDSDDDFVAEKDEEAQDIDSEEPESGVEEEEAVEGKIKDLEEKKKEENDSKKEETLEEENEDLDEEEEEILGDILASGDVPIHELKSAVKRAKEEKKLKKEATQLTEKQQETSESIPAEMKTKPFPAIPSHVEFPGGMAGKFPKIGKVKITPSRAELASQLARMPERAAMTAMSGKPMSFVQNVLGTINKSVEVPTAPKEKTVEPLVPPVGGLLLRTLQGEPKPSLGDGNIPVNHSKDSPSVPAPRPFVPFLQVAPPAGPLQMGVINSQASTGSNDTSMMMSPNNSVPPRPPFNPFQGVGSPTSGITVYPPNIPTTVNRIATMEASAKKKSTPKPSTKTKRKADDMSPPENCGDSSESGDGRDIKGIQDGTPKKKGRGRGKKQLLAEAQAQALAQVQGHGKPGLTTVQAPTQFPPQGLPPEGGSVITRMLNTPQGPQNFPVSESNQFPGRTRPPSLRPSLPPQFVNAPRSLSGMGIRPAAPSGNMFHTSRPLDPSPSGGGPINISISDGALPKTSPAAPSFSRPPGIARFPPDPSLRPPFPSQSSPLRPEFASYPNFYGNFPPSASSAPSEEPGFQGPPFQEQFGEEGPPAEGNSRSFEDETGGEFGGLASYFASQREEDLDT